MLALNGIGRYQLAAEVLRRTQRPHHRAPELVAESEALTAKALAYSHAYVDDPAEIRDWVWA